MLISGFLFTIGAVLALMVIWLIATCIWAE